MINVVYISKNKTKNISKLCTVNLRAPELILICRVFHPPTLWPLVDSVNSSHCCQRIVFIDSKKRCVYYSLDSFDSIAGHLV